MKQERQKGSITVEATLFIPIFLFAFMSIYSLVSFARAQLLIQYAADQAAREVAQYSYILEKTGILDAYQGMGQEAAGFDRSLKDIRENLSLIDDAAQKLASGQGTVDDTVGMGNAGKDVYDSVEGYVSNPKEFINGVLSSVNPRAGRRCLPIWLGQWGNPVCFSSLLWLQEPQIQMRI